MEKSPHLPGAGGAKAWYCHGCVASTSLFCFAELVQTCQEGIFFTGRILKISTFEKIPIFLAHKSLLHHESQNIIFCDNFYLIFSFCFSESILEKFHFWGSYKFSLYLRLHLVKTSFDWCTYFYRTAFEHRLPFYRMYYLPLLFYRVYNLLTAYPQTAFLQRSPLKNVN